MADAFHLAAGEGERVAFSGVELLIRASSETTGGSFSIIEEQNPLDTPRHVHAHEDELFPAALVTPSSRRAGCRTSTGGSSRERDAS